MTSNNFNRSRPGYTHGSYRRMGESLRRYRRLNEADEGGDYDHEKAAELIKQAEKTMKYAEELAEEVKGITEGDSQWKELHDQAWEIVHSGKYDTFCDALDIVFSDPFATLQGDLEEAWGSPYEDNGGVLDYLEDDFNDYENELDGIAGKLESMGAYAEIEELNRIRDRYNEIKENILDMADGFEPGASVDLPW